MCRSAAEGGRRCTGRSCGAAAARQRQRLCRARNALAAAHVIGDPAWIADAEAKYTAIASTPPPAPTPASTSTAPEKPMPTPEPQPSNPKTTSIPAGSIEDRVRDTVRELARKSGDWVGIVDVRKALGDVDHAELSRALKDMERNNPNVHLAPEDNRKALTEEDHAAAINLGGDAQHVIQIQPERDAGALGRVQAAGFTNATDNDLEQARLDIHTPTEIYDQIRAEQKRRQQQ
ncbi:hypothetical protein [Amycolatopsis magusensis]|uniref:hypothetical protein n=1 Tax=Amycolatopsis magusensis TaxID=882444 RepID=UPI0037954E71